MSHSDLRAQLEQAIAAASLDLYLVPMVDEFQGEYIPAYAARLPFLTGFDGSAGLGVFRAGAEKKHVLFVDGRYTLQAAAQVDGEAIEVINSGEVSFLDWLEREGEGLRIGFDPWLVTEAQREGWQKATAARGVQWIAHVANLVDGIWKDQPAPPAGEVQLHPVEFAGASYAEKCDGVLAAMKKHGADAVVLTQPDGINWLLNIRGADVPFNPLLLAHLLLRANGTAMLFTHPHTLSAEVAAYFKAEKIEVAPIKKLFDGKYIRPQLEAKTLLLDKASTAVGWFALAEKLDIAVVAGEDPTLLPKACKNAVELTGIRAAHQRDGLALTRFLHWFDAQNVVSKYPDELAVVDKLEQFRREDASYRGGSFATIAGAGSNGAIVHYRATAQSNRRARVGELFLLDSGGQYPDGTTDVTRTMFVSGPSGGTPAPAMKEHFTRVLKGHIALASIKFPAGTFGIQLDVLARQYLWEAGADYDHGTGHGVGAFLCVHEGPQRISKRGSTVPLLPGMIVSNEPGYYAPAQYGIRVESLIAVVELGKTADGKPLYGFETLTLAPIDTRLVEVSMLSVGERNWLNAYHRRVHDAHVAAFDYEGKRWLMQATRAI